MSLRILPISVRNLFKINAIHQGARTLYSLNSLGIDNFLTTKAKVSNQFESISDKFKNKMQEYACEESNAMIFTEDLKHMIYLANPTDTDLQLIEKMIVRFAGQNRELRFGSFIFGPVVMRMFHHLNKPDEALKLFFNPNVGPFFDQLITFQVLLDLLYRNEKYEEMLKVFDVISDKQLHGSKYPKNCVVLAAAACYKMNNEFALNYLKKLWSKLMEVGHQPMRRAGTYAAALALSQNAPSIAVEVLGSLKQPGYVTIRNLKVSALADLGRADDCFPILRSVLEVDSNRENKNTFTEETIQKVKNSIIKSGKKDYLDEFERIEKQLRANDQICEQSIDVLLDKEIITPNKNEIKPFQRKHFDQRATNNFRPGIRDML